MSETITALLNLKEELGGDTIVSIQSHGCCTHGHPAYKIEREQERGVQYVVIRG